MNNTSLIDFENNLKIKTDINNKIIIGEIKDTINFRIKKHREFIKKSKAIILENIDYLNIVEDETNKIVARKNKINELRELAEFSFGIIII
jgi:hypothetical protein